MTFTQRPDPIKAILATKVVKTKKIIVNTPKVTGGGATITPERALANVVSTSAEAREFETARYGLDIIMNINEFHQPAVATEELRVKLAAQRYQVRFAQRKRGWDRHARGGGSLRWERDLLCERGGRTDTRAGVGGCRWTSRGSGSGTRRCSRRARR